MKNRIVLITKDAMCKSYLSVYDAQKKQMPNLEELAAKGTVFTRFYTVAPSTAMSAIGMFLEKNPFETSHSNYVKVEKETNTAFDYLRENGYKCHIIWDECDVKLTKKFSECYGADTTFHIINIEQIVGSHNLFLDEIKENEKKSADALETMNNAIAETMSTQADKVFLWIHVPQVIMGRGCYGTDMDLFDSIIGMLRKYFADDEIFVSSDHGNMNGRKNKIAYGFDVYEPAACIPLITPRIKEMKVCDKPISNKDIFALFDGKIPQEEYIYVDTAYYAQPNRKLAIIHGDYKYIFNKKTKNEELYDLKFDPNEECNIIDKIKLDVDRNVKTKLNEVYYYPRWEQAENEKELLRREFSRVWKTETSMQRTYIRAKNIGRAVKRRLWQLSATNKTSKS